MENPPPPPGPSGLPPGKGEGEGSSSSSNQRQPVLDLFGGDMMPAAIVLVLLLLNLMSGAPSLEGQTLVLVQRSNRAKYSSKAPLWQNANRQLSVSVCVQHQCSGAPADWWLSKHPPQLATGTCID